MAGTSLGVQRFRPCLPVQDAQIQSMVGELRPHMPGGPKAKDRSSVVTNSTKAFKRKANESPVWQDCGESHVRAWSPAGVLRSRELLAANN